TGVLERLGLFGGPALAAPGGVPYIAADLVERVGGPGDHVERVRTADRVAAAGVDHVGDPVGAVGGHVRDGRAPLVAGQVEEPVQGGLVAARRGPDQPAGVVVDHAGDVLVPLLVGQLVDADAAQVGQPVNDRLRVGADPGHDRPDRAPRHAGKLADRGLG